jgi:hypothetical protein
MKDTWSVYRLGTRDFHEYSALTIDEFLARARAKEIAPMEYEGDFKDAEAAYLAATHGGDVLRDTVWVFWDWVADGPGFLFKEDNNGTTYMVVTGIDARGIRDHMWDQEAEYVPVIRLVPAPRTCWEPRGPEGVQ